ncbi:MAG TPA: hypothetical protein VLI43_12205 [Gemmatimonadaceae bacterium]|nr:hypothetical protein [Gemmatimonadaceae bacterium]
MLTRRDSLGGAIIFLWLVGLALLARRELFVAEPEQLLEAALLVVPGTAYYEVMSGDERVGWASASIDTSRSGISVRDVMVIDAPDSAAKRFAARARVTLTPGLRLTGFTFELGGDHGPYRVSGKMSEDTVLQLITATGKSRADTARMPVQRAVLWPTTVPLALALADRPKVGRTYRYSIYDPTTGAPEDVQLQVGAESLFVVPDSAKRDETSGRWIMAHEDTVRGWRLDPQGSTLVSGWIDARGRAIETRPIGTFTLRRTAYELAFQNWTLDAKRRTAGTRAHHTPTNH